MSQSVGTFEVEHILNFFGKFRRSHKTGQGTRGGGEIDWLTGW
jgi:hypothetical protein